MWESRVVIPPSLRSKVMDELHGGHLNYENEVSGMKSLVEWTKILRGLWVLALDASV